MPAGVSTYLADAGDYNEQYISIEGTRYYTVNYCGEFACYYLNANGGWDAFLFEGKCKRKDEFTQSEYAKDYDNRTTQFGRMRYVNRIASTYELHTGWLTEEESERFAKHLAPTTSMYLHNLVTGEIFPVTVQETAVDRKTYSSENNQLITYVLTVKTSQDRYRR